MVDHQSQLTQKIDVEALEKVIPETLAAGIATSSKVTIVPTVTFAKTDPDELTAALAAGPRAAAVLKCRQNFSLTLRMSRAKLIEAVQNAREVPLVWQEVILAEIAVIPPAHDLLRLDFLRHGHGVGSNAVFTVKEI